MLISNVVINSLNNFKDGLLSFFSYLNRESSNGLTLDESSNILLTNVDKLNISSNEAAALEEITSNIRNNTENIAKCSNCISNP